MTNDYALDPNYVAVTTADGSTKYLPADLVSGADRPPDPNPTVGGQTKLPPLPQPVMDPGLDAITDEGVALNVTMPWGTYITNPATAELRAQMELVAFSASGAMAGARGIYELVLGDQWPRFRDDMAKWAKNPPPGASTTAALAEFGQLIKSWSEGRLETDPT